MKTKSEVTAGFYEISYAYPSSPNAVFHGFAKNGCYVYLSADEEIAYLSMKEASLHAQHKGLKRGLFSLEF